MSSNNTKKSKVTSNVIPLAQASKGSSAKTSVKSIKKSTKVQHAKASSGLAPLSTKPKSQAVPMYGVPNIGSLPSGYHTVHGDNKSIRCRVGYWMGALYENTAGVGLDALLAPGETVSSPIYLDTTQGPFFIEAIGAAFEMFTINSDIKVSYHPNAVGTTNTQSATFVYFTDPANTNVLSTGGSALVAAFQGFEDSVIFPVWMGWTKTFQNRKKGFKVFQRDVGGGTVADNRLEDFGAFRAIANQNSWTAVYSYGNFFVEYDIEFFSGNPNYSSVSLLSTSVLSLPRPNKISQVEIDYQRQKRDFEQRALASALSGEQFIELPPDEPRQPSEEDRMNLIRSTGHAIRAVSSELKMDPVKAYKSLIETLLDPEIVESFGSSRCLQTPLITPDIYVTPNVVTDVNLVQYGGTSLTNDLSLYDDKRIPIRISSVGANLLGRHTYGAVNHSFPNGLPVLPYPTENWGKYNASSAGDGIRNNFLSATFASNDDTKCSSSSSSSSCLQTPMVPSFSSFACPTPVPSPNHSFVDPLHPCMEDYVQVIRPGLPTSQVGSSKST